MSDFSQPPHVVQSGPDSEDAANPLVYTSPRRRDPLVEFFERALLPLDPPVCIRELLAIIAAVVIADIALYAGGGLAGYGVMLLVMPLILFPGTVRRSWTPFVYILTFMLAIVGLRLLWLGSAWAVLTGFLLVFLLGMSLMGFRPFILESLLYFVQVMLSGLHNLIHYTLGMTRLGGCSKLNRRMVSLPVLAVPVVVILVFVVLFTLANPVLREMASDWLRWTRTVLRDLPLSIRRIMFWGVVLTATAGLVRTSLMTDLLGFLFTYKEKLHADDGRPPLPPFAYPTARNTLLAVVVLFAVYLVFEFVYLWMREIPEGFNYAAYAHEGAFWLTVALAFSTLTMGSIFAGQMNLDEKAPALRRIAWIWSIENILLAVAVFHRTYIYIVYNGMSRMRVVAIMGIAVVVAGFLLVVYMVATRHTVVWLVRRQLWAFGIVLFLLVVLPVDKFATAFNVNRIMGGNHRPTVQLTHHPINAEGVTMLLPLLGHEDARIREGAAALIAQKQADLRLEIERAPNWSYMQLARSNTLEVLEPHQASWEHLTTEVGLRQAVMGDFWNYGHQWFD